MPRPDLNGQKQCTKCLETKPAEAFYRRSDRGRLTSWCKDCWKESKAQKRAEMVGPCPVEGCQNCVYGIGGKIDPRSENGTCKFHGRGADPSLCACLKCHGDRRAKFDPRTGLKTCSGCDWDLPLDAYYPQRGSKCKTCLLEAAAQRYAEKSGTCPVEGCQNCVHGNGGKPNNPACEPESCNFHRRGGDPSLCGCRRCSYARLVGGSFRILEQLEEDPTGQEAMKPARLYLLRIKHGDEQFLTYGISVDTGWKARLRSYTRELESVTVLRNWQSTRIECARAEDWLKASCSHIAYKPQVKLEKGRGIATESMVDCAEAHELWHAAQGHASTPRQALTDLVA